MRSLSADMEAYICNSCIMRFRIQATLCRDQTVCPELHSQWFVLGYGSVHSQGDTL